VRALIPITPDPVALQLGPLTIHWYGIGYAVGLAAAYVVMTREARRRGLDARVIDSGIVIVALAGLLGARAYHVIDEWDRYSGDLLAVALPPYTGLGVLGGIVTGTIAMFIIMRVRRQSFWHWADIVAPGAFVMQAIARWGNFFNQELYGPPTDLPWGMSIQCRYRAEQWPCAEYPQATTGFQPLFLYESISGALGAVALLWIARRWGARMRPGDLFLIWVIWYSVVRFALEPLRTGNWAVSGIPTAMIMSTVLTAGALGVLAWRHRPAAKGADRWSERPRVAHDVAA
jgi:phosphatidylglycerol:prolipoprotein diacylglycerol transferase